MPDVLYVGKTSAGVSPKSAPSPSSQFPTSPPGKLKAVHEMFGVDKASLENTVAILVVLGSLVLFLFGTTLSRRFYRWRRRRRGERGGGQGIGENTEEVVFVEKAKEESTEEEEMDTVKGVDAMAKEGDTVEEGYVGKETGIQGETSSISLSKFMVDFDVGEISEEVEDNSDSEVTVDSASLRTKTTPPSTYQQKTATGLSDWIGKY